MAIDHLGECVCGDPVARRFGLFSWYAANIGNFNKTYGSLGAIVGFMTWMWLLIIVVLVGAKLNEEVERETMRGAKMADASCPS
jgi:uncharacterized BrkB/YihY/UPF0761 family membrane protein